MALTAALHGALVRGARGKNDTLVGTVLLENSTVKPYGRILGKLIVRTDTELKHFGIRVQFEAVCSLQFETKFDSRTTSHKRVLNVISTMMDNDSEGYQTSPVTVEIMEARPTLSENQIQTWTVIMAEQPAPNLPPARPYVMHPGIHNFGFELNLSGENAPAPFRSPYGNLVYKVVAYIKNENAAFVPIADKSIRYAGYHNLLLNEEADKAICLERTLKKSMFSSKKFVTAILRSDRSGFLPDEDIQFTLSINNPKSMTLSSVVVTLVQKVNYCVGSAVKSTTNILDKKEYQVKEPKTELDWHGRLKIKKRQMPSFSGHDMYHVAHYLMFKVQAADYGSIKAEAQIFIGTTREPPEDLQKAAALPENPESKALARVKRQASSASTTSTMSAMSEFETCTTRTRTPSEESVATVADADAEEDEASEATKKMDELTVSPGEGGGGEGDEISTSSV